MTGMTLEIQDRKDGALFIVSGRLMYESDSREFQSRLNEQIQLGKKWIVADLSHVIGMSSTGLGILIGAHRITKERDLVFRLAHLSDKVRSVLQITRLNSVFEIYDSVEEAMQ